MIKLDEFVFFKSVIFLILDFLIVSILVVKKKIIRKINYKIKFLSRYNLG